MVTTRILGTSILCSADIYAPQKEKIKVLLNFFQKIAVSKGRAFGRLPQKAKHSSWTSSTLIVRRLCGWIFQSKYWIEKEGAFVREKPPWQTNNMHCSEKPPSGRFFCCLCCWAEEQIDKNFVSAIYIYETKLSSVFLIIKTFNILIRSDTSFCRQKSSTG